MTFEKKNMTAEMILTAAIDDYASKTGKTISEVRDEIINSGAYDALFDFESGLWTQGPDYFLDYFIKMKNRKRSYL